MIEKLKCGCLVDGEVNVGLCHRHFEMFSIAKDKVYNEENPHIIEGYQCHENDSLER